MLGIIMAIITTIILIKIYLKNVDKKIDTSFIIETIKKYFFIIISYVILTTLIFSIFYNNPYFKNIIENSSSKIYDIIILIMLSMSTSLFILGFGSMPIKYLKDKIYVKKIEKTYEVKDIEYYRDIIKNVSPAILSFCYKNRISFSDELIALLLHLQMRKIINIKDNKIIFIGDVNLLTESEKFAIRHIKKFNFKIKKEYKRLLTKEMIKENYIIIDKSKNIICNFLSFIMIWLIIYSLITICVYFNISKLGYTTIITYVLTFCILPTFCIFENKFNLIIKTKKSMELNAKLNGLKKFIKEFSILENSNINDISLYDEYIIYTLLFNLKGKLNNECKQLYRSIKRIKFDSIENYQ